MYQFVLASVFNFLEAELSHYTFTSCIYDECVQSDMALKKQWNRKDLTDTGYILIFLVLIAIFYSEIFFPSCPVYKYDIWTDMILLSSHKTDMF